MARFERALRRQAKRAERAERYRDYRDLYREVQADAHAHGAELPVPLLPKSRKARRRLGFQDLNG